MRNIILTGPPGVGKTTLVKKLVNQLKAENTYCNGFYTEEIRANNYRTGFDIVTFQGERAILARKSTELSTSNRPKVGQYEVYLNDFEKLALPELSKPKRLLIIDEIGKMEMLSKKFEESVRSILKSNDIQIIATVPLKGGALLAKQMKEDKNNRLITVNSSNRDILIHEITEILVSQ